MIPFLASVATGATVCDTIDPAAIPDLEPINVRQYTTRSYPSLRPMIWVAATFTKIKEPDTVFQAGWWLAPANWYVIVNNKRVTGFNLFFDKGQFTAFFDIVGAHKGDKITIRALVPKKKADRTVNTV